MKKNDINTNPIPKTPADYVKLQDAYVAEKGIRVGTWKEIGYLMKNSSNFYYCDAAACTNSTNAAGYGDVTTIDEYIFVSNWTATNVATLNDCNANSHWTLTTSGNSSAGGLVSYSATVDGASGKTGAGNCAVLTPNFRLLHTAS
ncbi:hypothetical protein [Fibrobacter sp. HC4]|uniref:hypothetical protein n=1 Tax=Fibrobacter sp. HC4 TaxID=3239812 RepID=UPI0020199819|nr:hypothetical protein [Fibrobacter succinogenes]MCL4100562.1 hypothetical protein [Fibrobacter succinogenes]